MNVHAAVFESVDLAQAAAKALGDHDFNKDDFFVLEPNQNDKLDEALQSSRWGESLDGLRNRLRDAVTDGRAVLVVYVPFGKGIAAEKVFEEHTALKMMRNQKLGGPLFSATLLPMLWRDPHRIGPYFSPFTFSTLVLPAIVRGHIDPVFPKTLKGHMDPAFPKSAKGHMDPVFPKIIRGHMDPIFPHISPTGRRS